MSDPMTAPSSRGGVGVRERRSAADPPPRGRRDEVSDTERLAAAKATIEKLEAAVDEADTLLHFAVGMTRTESQAALIDRARRQWLARLNRGGNA